MKQVFKCLAVCLFTISFCDTCLAQFINSNDTWWSPIKGKADSVIIKEYDIKSKASGKTMELNERATYIFNTKGLLIEDRSSDYDQEGSGPIRSIYSYNDMGYCTQLSHYNSNGTLTQQEVYTYDEKRRLVEVNRKGPYVKTTMLLDKAGNIIEEIHFNEYAEKFSTIVNNYDGFNRCIETVQSWTKSTDVQRTVYTYNGLHNLVKEVNYDGKGRVSVYTYNYPKLDKRHNWLVQNRYYEDKLITVNQRFIAYSK